MPKLDYFLLFLTTIACLTIFSEWVRRKIVTKRRRCKWYAEMARNRAIEHARKWILTKNPIYLELFALEMEVVEKWR